MNKDNDILARFDAEFGRGGFGASDIFEQARAFILKEIERALTEQRRVIFQRYRQIGDADTANSILAERFESGITAERERILALIEPLFQKYEDGGDERYGYVKHFNTLLLNLQDDLTAAINNPNTQ